MNWFLDLLLGDSVAHAILVLSIVIAIGLTLGRWKVGGVSIGSAWILFAGIAFGHAGLVVDSHTLHFVREFGPIAACKQANASEVSGFRRIAVL